MFGGRALLGQKFLALIFLGVIVFVLLPVFSHVSYCEAPRDKRPVETSQQAAAQQAEENAIGLYEQQTASGYKPSAKRDEPITWFCDIKITDVALVFFTYCLVIVGWATIASSEYGAWVIERPMVRLSHLRFSRYGGDIRDKTKMPVIAIAFTNHGRSVAVVTKVRLVISVIGTLPEKPDYEAGLNKGYIYVPVGQTIEPNGGKYTPEALRFSNFGDYLSKPGTPVGDLGFPFLAHLWVYGYIAYLDHLGDERTHGFVGMWLPPDLANPSGEPTGEQFMLSRKKNYTYDK